MGIFAEVSFRQLSVSASYRQIHATAGVPAAAVVIDTQSPSPEVSFQNLFSSVSFRLLTPQLNWQKLFVDDVVLNTERTIFFFSDSFGFSDSASLEPNLGSFDQFTFTDLHEFTISAGRADSLPLIDSPTISLSLANSDAFIFSDTETLAFSKGLSDTATISESLATLITFERSFEDISQLTDQLTVSQGAVLDDSLGVIDSPAVGSFKPVSDFVAASDIETKGVDKEFVEFVVVDDANLSMSIAGFTYQVGTDGVLDIVTSFSDSFAPQEAASMTLQRPLFDAFTLDDFSQVDKDFFGGKSNIYTMSDSLLFGFSMTQDESIIFTDAAAKSLATTASDSFAISDQASRTTGTVLTDNVSMGESLALAEFSASAVLNKGLVGFMLLNAD